MAIANWTNNQVINQLNSGSKWTGSTITYAFPTTASGIYSAGEGVTFRPVSSAQQPLFVLALQAWDDLIAPNFQQTTSTASNIEFGYTSSNIDYAHAYFPTTGSVWFKSGSDVASATIGTYGFCTVLHELGHAIGLNHMGNYNGQGNWTPSSYQDSKVVSLMSYFGPDGGLRSTEVFWADWTALDGGTYSPQTPMLNDVLAIQTMYGASTTTRTGNTVYGFGSNVTGNIANIYDFTINRNPILTIFDSGGADVLNLSGWNTSSYIYLESGTFSSCDGMTNNISIAYGCVIEDAVGGGGNDILTGNASANRLEGGSGNDQLDGAAGNDTLVGGLGNDSIVGGTGEDTAVFSGAFSSYTISYNSVSGTYSVSGTATGIDTISGVEYFQFADGVKSANQLLSTDTVAPSLVSLSPSDGAINVSVGANLLLSFDETVQAGAGNFVIYNANGSIARTIAVTDTAQVSIVGRVVTINPLTDLASGGAYYLNMSAGVLKDLAGNFFVGISGSTTYNFSTATVADISPPTLLSTSPADNAISVSAAGNLVFTFSESMQAGVGNIIIYNANGTVARTIAVTDTSQVSIAGSTVTINPSTDLAAGSGFYLNISAGVLKDLAGNSFPGISGTGAFNFTTAASNAADDYPWNTATNGLVVVNGSGTSGVVNTPSDADLFKVSLVVGTTYVFSLSRTNGGLTDPYLTLYNPAVELIASDDDSGGLQNSKITYTATSSGTYYLGAMDYGTGTGAYSISAVSLDTTAPTLLSMSPADNESSISPSANLVLSFNEAVLAASGNITIYNANGSIARTIAVSDTTQVSVAGGTVTINLSADLAYGSSYYVNIAAGSLTDLAGNRFAGVSGATAFNFSTVAASATDDYPWDINTTGIVIVNGQGRNGVIDFTDDADAFKVTLTAGTAYLFTLTKTAGGLADPYLQLYSPDAELIAFDDDSAGSLNAKISYTANSTGTYYLGAMDQGAGTGAYTISATALTDDYPWDTGTTGSVVVNGPGSNGMINAQDDADLFKVTLSAGSSYVFNLSRTTGGLADPYLMLYNQSVELIATDDDSGGTQNAKITYTATSSGTYYLGVMDYATGTGGYQISATSVDISGVVRYGSSGSDIFRGGAGNDTFDGLSGIDFIQFSGNRINFSIRTNTSGYQTTDNSGNEGIDTLVNIERLQFADITLALDISSTPGQVYRLYQAAFDRKPDSGGLGYWIYGMDHGMPLLDVSAGFINSREFISLYGQSSTTSDLVIRLYQNVLDRNPEQAGYDYWLNQIDSGYQTRTQVLIGFSESLENQAQVIGAIQNGIEYSPHVV